MRRVLIVIAALLAVIAIAVVGALTLIPDSVYRDEIKKAAKEATGRDVDIAGGIGLSLYPVLGVKAEDVTLANAPGFNALFFARMKELDAGVKLWPLFSGKVEIARFALVEPDIALEVDAKGNNNWTFETAAKKAPEAEEKGAGGELSELSLGTMRLVDGHVSYDNRQSREKWEASDINLAVSLPNLDEPLNVDGGAKWKGQAVSLALKAEKPRALFDGQSSPVVLDVKSDLVKLAFAGEAATGKELSLSGPVDLSTPSLRKLLSWLSEPPSELGAEGKTLGAFALKGLLSLKGDVTRVDNAALSLDGMTGKGKLSVNSASSRPRPFVDAALALDRLDVDSYLKDSSAPAAESAAGGGGSSGGGSAGGWSDERMDFSGLKSADADLALSAAKAVFSGMTLNDATLGIHLRDGVLTADLPNLKLYGGKGAAKIVLDGGGQAPSLRSDLALSGIAVEPFLRDTAQFDRVTGTGALVVTLTSRGGSERAMMENLNGAGTLKLTDGAVRGINLAAMVRNIASAFTGAAAGGAQQTDFAELGGSFSIQNGVLANNDFMMVNPYLRLAGAGTANIVNRTVDYRFVPKLVKSSEGQGGKLDLTGVSVPVHVTGSWDNLKFAPDAKGLVEGALKGASEALGAGEDPLKGALQGLFGRPGAKPKEDGGATESGGTQEGTPTTEQKPAPTPEEQMRDIFQDIFKPQ